MSNKALSREELLAQIHEVAIETGKIREANELMIAGSILVVDRSISFREIYTVCTNAGWDVTFAIIGNTACRRITKKELLNATPKQD